MSFFEKLFGKLESRSVKPSETVEADVVPWKQLCLNVIRASLRCGDEMEAYISASQLEKDPSSTFVLRMEFFIYYANMTSLLAATLHFSGTETEQLQSRLAIAYAPLLEHVPEPNRAKAEEIGLATAEAAHLDYAVAKLTDLSDPNSFPAKLCTRILNVLGQATPEIIEKILSVTSEQAQQADIISLLKQIQGPHHDEK
jgi:hypothetical protein